jgi:hypothetical protein
MLPVPPVPSDATSAENVRFAMRNSPCILSELSEEAREYVARIIRETGWDDESLAAGAFIMSHVDLVKRARAREVSELQPEEQIPFYSLLTFLGLSKDELHAFG